MARGRQKTSVFDDLFGIVAALPWWIGVGLAAASYLVLHRYAIAQLPTSPVPGQVGETVVAQMVKSFSIYMQYVFPILLLAAAAASYFKRKQRKHLVAEVANHGTAAVRGMTWKEFELLVGEGFRLLGYTVTESGGGGADGGVDLMLKKGAELFLVQCKQWKALKVSVTTVRELYGVMAARGAAGGFVVTSGTFTRDARDFADGRNIELIDGLALETMISRAVRARTLRAEPTLTQEPGSRPSAQADPLCPKCGGPMLRRVAKQGANVGKEFWGCKTFPACRGVRDL